MELRNFYVIFIGVAVLILLTAFLFIKTKRKNEYKGGKKVADNDYIQNDPYFKKKVIKYRIYTVILVAACFLGIAVCFAMLTRPYKRESAEKEKYNRDIVLCIDISSSVDYLNMHLVEELKSTVGKLKGERFGIVIFNTTPVTITPLTTDYEYITEQLDLIGKCLVERNKTDWDDDDLYNWLYMDQYITEGTMVGSDERGSSLIGDGLAAGAYEFGDKEEDRTKIIIFSTDNDLQGKPIFTLDEAASVCKSKNITVYGIGTKEMFDEDMDEMRAAVKKTGGEFYLEEESGTFGQIVKNIEKTSKSLLKEKTEIREVELVGVPFVVLLLSVSVMTIFVKITKR